MDTQRLTLADRFAGAFVGAFFGLVIGGILALFSLVLGRDTAAAVFVFTLAVFAALGFAGSDLLGDFLAIFGRVTVLLTVVAGGAVAPGVDASWFRPLFVLVLFVAFVTVLFWFILM